MERIAIVNRGDAASRCLRAIRELRAIDGVGLTAIALYTDVDRDAPFVREADVALSLGPVWRSMRGGPPRLAYLDHGRVLAALRATGADTVWPGWGLLAEDADFAAALEARGLCFVGPSSDAMRRLGDKIAAKQLAERSNVPVAAWSGAAVDARTAVQRAQAIGLPLLVKAAAGGGGRGIRVVEQWSELDGAVARAAAEATAAFGDGRVFLEQLVRSARHIEVQIAADAQGDCLALGLRECSVQRRHQKIIEEAPPPDLADDVAAALCDAAVRLARAVDYRGLGTVEFLLRDDGRSFVFLEVNPRLQVEHGLTELLTGIDLVQLQLRLARGEALPAQVPASRGHAFEARVCAEDPAAEFAPAPGVVVLYDPPGGTGVRVDAGVTRGSAMPAEFDQMIAKVLAHAPTRRAALARLSGALQAFRLVLDGGATNKGLLLDVLADEDVRRGAVDVDWLDRTLPTRFNHDRAALALIAAAVAVYQEARAAARDLFFAEAATGTPRSVPADAGIAIDLSYGGTRYRVHVLAIGDWRYRVACDGRECIVRLRAEPPYAAQLEIGAARHAVTFAPAVGGLRIEVDGRPHRVGRDDGGAVRAVAPAVVIAVEVAVGDSVRAGQRLALLETMKVEVPVLAPAAGVVREIAVRPQARVPAGAVLLTVDSASMPPATTATAPRVAFPEWSDPLAALRSRSGEIDLARLAAQDLRVRESAIDALAAMLRGLLLGFDRRADLDAPLDALFAAPLPTGLMPERLAELAPLSAALQCFVDTEVLFSRQPSGAASGDVGLSHDAWLRIYVRQRGARGDGLPETFVALLRRALAHYGCGDLTPGDALDRALMRLFAAHARRDARHRIVAALLRWLTRLAAVGVAFDDDAGLATALGSCLALRAQAPDALADAAADARYVMFERPAAQRRGDAALAEAIAPLERREAVQIDLETVRRLADSPPALFARVAAWARDADVARRDLALQGLVLRDYAGLAPQQRQSWHGDGWMAVRFSGDPFGCVLAALAGPTTVGDAMQALLVAAAERRAAHLEIFVALDDESEEPALQAFMAQLPAQARAGVERIGLNIITTRGESRHRAFERRAAAWCERHDLHGLHPQTARRLGLERLADFALERLAAPDGVYAFHGRSRSAPEDERLFILAEVRAALPGTRGTLHEPAFVHAFAEAVRALRGLRGTRERWQRLQWNRITLVVRPALTLLPATLDRLVAELTPATRHLGLEKLVVRLTLRATDAGAAECERELVVEPTAAGADVGWRTPHHAPLRPTSATEQRIAEARRRGLVYPYEAIRLFTADGGQFEELDLGANGRVMSVVERPAGGNTCGVVFGIISTPTAKHPDGMARVLVLSDPTRELGALAAPECDRLIAALDVAAARGVPVEWLATSAGARIALDSGTENLDATARVVRRIVRFTDAGGEINVIVAGVNVGAQSYFDALATMGPATRGILIMLSGSAMVLTGRLALEASGGVAADDETGLGGFDRIMGPSGQAQYYARDLAAAYALLLAHYRFTYRTAGEARPRRHATRDPVRRSIGDAPYTDDGSAAFARVGEIFDDAANPGRKRPFAMRPVLRALIDQDGGWLERWASMAGAETAIVADAHLGGHAICLIGIESQPVPRLGPRAVDGPAEWSAGTLFPLSAKKIARALAAASGVRPAVIMATLSGFDGSPESMRTLQLEHGAAIARAVVHFDGPLLFVVVSRYHGGAYVVFSRALNDRLHAVALEGSYASVIGGSAAAVAVFGRDVQARTDADARVRACRDALAHASDAERAAALAIELERVRQAVLLEQHGTVAREFDAVHTVERARAVGSLDAVLPVDALRPFLIRQLDADASPGPAARDGSVAIATAGAKRESE